jgi:hypothetical protein
MLNVGARVSDACRIGRQHKVEGRLKFVAWKGRGKKKSRSRSMPHDPADRAGREAARDMVWVKVSV